MINQQTQDEMRQQLSSGVDSLAIELLPEQLDLMIAFLVILQKWNKTHNLTAIHQPTKMVTHHLLDSLVIIPHLHGEFVLDVGTGGGVPGIPLAIACPQMQFSLIDSNSKKTSFIQHIIQSLGLTNVAVHHQRIERFSQTQRFDVIIARAVSTLSNILSWTRHLLKEDGEWQLMKGAYPEAELNGIELPYRTVALEVPGLAAERHLVVIEQTGR